MNNLAYGSQDKEKVAPKVEELLRKELAATAPMAYTVEEEGNAGVTAKSLLKDMSTTLFGGAETPLFTVHFQIAQPRPIELGVHMKRKGVGCVGGPLVFSATVGKPCGSGVALGDDGKFTGDAAVAGKLNASKDILKKSNAFAMTNGGMPGSEMKIPRTLKIVAGERGTEIVAVTLPRSKSMGFSASLGSGDFFELVSGIEALL